MNNSILIIGEGLSFGINQIIKQDSKKVVANLYGEDSDITKAFNISFDIGVKNIYLANIQVMNSVIDICQSARQYNFKYIIPVGIRFSDKAFNKTLGRHMSFAEIILKIISTTSDSIVVMTDNHASLYEDIDSFLDDMKSKINRFKLEAVSALANGRQLWFVANNLKDIKFSNIVLASTMIMTQIPNYPSGDITQAIFDIDETDVKNELIYFKNNVHAKNSIENFLNFHNKNDVYKVVMIDMVIRKINEELDLSSFSGKLFNGQVKLKIQNAVKKYLSSVVGRLIRDYKINMIDAQINSSMCYDIYVYFQIFPMNSLEECNVLIEV